MGASSPDEAEISGIELEEAPLPAQPQPNADISFEVLDQGEQLLSRHAGNAEDQEAPLPAQLFTVSDQSHLSEVPLAGTDTAASSSSSWFSSCTVM